ncbi:hypothetical protein [Fischerella sp. PCC 9605]|uniref:nSTAND3 domain-containing NTPase n=1 Tax=Fischerella sp. PCC 9605 TaxID=1173024 RepID=UPI00047E93CD|nr:hypothetical protein [Fischerella sp. PCC 9605]
MSDDSEQNPSSGQQNTEKSGQDNKSEGAEAFNHTNPQEEFFKKLLGEDTARNINESLQWQGAANIYIDARSGGAYFANQVDIEGDIVGGNQTKSIKRSSVKDIAGQVLSADIEKVRSVYVETTSYQQAKRILKEKHVLILWGDSKFGKQTTAIHLLSHLKTEEIFEIDPGVEDLSLFQCQAKQVYVIDTLASDSAYKLSSYLLKGLNHKLRQQDSYLVITVDSRVRLSPEALGDYILNWSELPNNEELLEKHLAWYFKDQSMLDNSHSLIESESVRQLLNHYLLPGEVDQLAEILAKVVRKELEPEEALARFSVRVREQVESWFEKEENQDLSKYVFMITLAVLSGSSYQAVVDASQRLQFLIKPPLDGKEVADAEPLFNRRRSQWLKDVCAHLTDGYENTEFGRSRVELIELDNPRFQPAVLHYVWKEYDRLREPLLLWLCELGSHPSFEVRIRAAAAVGELSKYAFGFVLDKVLRPWANCEDRRLQRLAAQAISIPVFESDLAPQVLGLLHHWSTVNNPNLRWTATAAYGGYVGLRFPDIALRDLFAIAKSGDRLLFLALAESVVILFEAGQFLPGQYLKVLNTLQVWTEQTKTNMTNQLSLGIFLLLMREPKVPPEFNNSHLPTLLWLLWEEYEFVQEHPKTERTYEKIVTDLLRSSLNLKLTRKLVLDELHNWLKLVDFDRRLLPVLWRIIYLLVNQGIERERERILKYLQRWADVEQANAASKILSKIQKYLNI